MSLSRFISFLCRRRLSLAAVPYRDIPFVHKSYAFMLCKLPSQPCQCGRTPEYQGMLLCITIGQVQKTADFAHDSNSSRGTVPHRNHFHYLIFRYTCSPVPGSFRIMFNRLMLSLGFISGLDIELSRMSSPRCQHHQISF